MSEAFTRFWARYPKKQAKKDALKAWVQEDCDKHEGDIMTALDWQTRQQDWIKDGGQYVPLPASYIRGWRWTDEQPEQPQVSGKTARILDAAARWAQR